MNVFKYFKDEAMKFPPNHPQRSYVKKTTEATGLSQRTISWMCQSLKSSTASSSAAAWKVHPRAFIVDDLSSTSV